MKANGFEIIKNLFAAPSLETLREDAIRRAASGTRTEFAGGPMWQGRGGSPARAYRSASGARLQFSLFSSPEITGLLGEIAGLSVEATGGGTYSYYEREGDFLGLHRDIITCDVALITCLIHSAGDANRGGLLLYPQFSREPLSAARDAGRKNAVAADLAPGESIVLLGGLIPHEIVPMGALERRVVSVMCYRDCAKHKEH